MFDAQGVGAIATTMVLAGPSWLGGLGPGKALALVAWCLGVSGIGISLSALRGLSFAVRRQGEARTELRVPRAAVSTAR